MGVNIKDLKNTSTLDNTDYLIVEKEEGTRKISASVINELINDNDVDYVTKEELETAISKVEAIPGPKGEKGEVGEQGERGIDGLTTSIEIKGSVYEHSEGKIKLPDLATEEYVGKQIEQAKTNVNLSNYATKSYVTNAIEEIELMPGPQGPRGETGPPGPQGEQAKVDDNLTSDSIVNALSSNQGKILNEKIEDIISSFDEVVLARGNENNLKTRLDRIDCISTTNKDEIKNTKDELAKNIEKVYGTINDGSFISFEDTEVKIDNAKEGYIKNLIIKGKTVQDDSSKEIESVGEKEDNKISILLSNKNLITLEDVMNISKKFTMEKDSDGTIWVHTHNIYLNYDREDQKIYKNFKENTSYTLSFAGLTDDKSWGLRPTMHYSDGTISQGNYSANNKKNTVTSNPNKTLTAISLDNPWSFQNKNLKINVSVLQLEENIKATSYAPFTQNKKEIPLQQPLRSLPNNVFDSIEQRNDGFYLIKRIEKIAYIQGDEDLENCITDKTFSYKAKAIPVEEKLNIDILSLETFKDVTYITSGNNIKPVLSFKAPVDVPATISLLKIKNNDLEKENKELKEDIKLKTNNLHEQDIEIINSNLDLDFRLFELEMLIEDNLEISTIKIIKGVGNMARTPFEMMKILVLNNNYNREDIEYKANKYLKGNRITKEEYDELISLMDANEIVK